MSETTWNILRVQSPFEARVAGHCLVDLGLKAYVPVETRKVVLRQRVIERPRCLMPGYVFIGTRGDMSWADVLEIRHAIRPLRYEDGRIITVTDAEVERVRVMERLHNRALHDRRTYRTGERVREPGGPFSSIEYLLRSVRGDEVKLEAHMDGMKITRHTTVDSLERVA